MNAKNKLTCNIITMFHAIVYTGSVQKRRLWEDEGGYLHCFIRRRSDAGFDVKVLNNVRSLIEFHYWNQQPSKVRRYIVITPISIHGYDNLHRVSCKWMGEHSCKEALNLIVECDPNAGDGHSAITIRGATLGQ
jgi:hypothetical protein